MKVPLLLALAGLTLVADLPGDPGRRLTVTVTNIPAAQGNLLVGVYDSPESFTGQPLPQSKKLPLAAAGQVTTEITGLAPGVYAVAVIQDLNSNGELDRNLAGMPTEPLAFSKVKRIPRGKPSFKACSFQIRDADVSLTIPLVTE